MDKEKMQPTRRYSRRIDRHLRVAFLITALEPSKDSGDRMNAELYYDGAAVLAHSVLMTQPSPTLTPQMVALAAPNATNARHRLRALGYRVIMARIPVTKGEVRGKYLRQTFDDAGCCGSAELLKLRAYELIQYDLVLALDMDALVLHPLEPLLRRAIAERRSLLYLPDPYLATPDAAAPPANGGWLLIRPSMRVFRELVEVVRGGDFRAGSGWGGSRIGWCWGGRTVQGLLPYYYAKRAPPTASEALDRCLYNVMQDDGCEHVPFERVQTVHFTHCQKPWSCQRLGNKRMCAAMTDAWWAARAALESASGVQPQRCVAGSYPRLAPSVISWLGSSRARGTARAADAHDQA